MHRAPGDTVEEKSLRRRAKELTGGDWAAGAVKQAIDVAAAAATAGAGGGAYGGDGS
jgi:hypothetical protein